MQLFGCTPPTPFLWLVQDMIAAPLSADDRGLMCLHPITAFVPLGLECMMWQNRLTQSNLHAAHDSDTASLGVHAEALLAQHRARRGRSRRSTHLRSLAAIAVSHSALSSQGSAQRQRLCGQPHHKSRSPVKSASQRCRSRKQSVTSR